MVDRPYYVLLQRVNNKWQVEFGSFKRSEVTAERDYYTGYYAKAKDLKIIVTTEWQKDIDEAVRKLNADV